MAAADTGNIIHLADIDTRAPEIRNASFVVTATEGRMSLLCRTKIVFYAHVNLNDAALEPASATCGKLARFWQFDHAQDFNVEMPGGFFSTHRHSQLDVINGCEYNVGHSSHYDYQFIALPVGLTPDARPPPPVRIKY
jgi:hypothetical protein